MREHLRECIRSGVRRECCDSSLLSTHALDDVAVTIATIDGQCFLDFHVARELTAGLRPRTARSRPLTRIKNDGDDRE